MDSVWVPRGTSVRKEYMCISVWLIDALRCQVQHLQDVFSNFFICEPKGKVWCSVILKRHFEKSSSLPSTPHTLLWACFIPRKWAVTLLQPTVERGTHIVLKDVEKHSTCLYFAFLSRN